LLTYVNNRLTSLFILLSIIAGLLIFCVGIVVLSLRFFLPDLFPGLFLRGMVMPQAAAVCFILLSFSILCLHSDSLFCVYTRRICAVTAAVTGFITFIGYVPVSSSGNGRFIPVSVVPWAGFRAFGTMYAVTALNFLLCGFGLLLFQSTRQKARGAGGLFLLANGIVALFAVVGYVLETPELYNAVQDKSIALYTAVSFILVCPAALFSRRDSGLMAVFASDTEGGFMARRLIFVCISLPFVLGWLVLMGERRGYYGPSLGVFLLTILIIVIFTFLIWDNAMSLHVIDIKRMKVEDALRASEDKYRVIFETTGTATAILQENKIISLVNTEFEKLSGFTKAQIEGVKFWTDFVATQEDLAVMSEYHRARRANASCAPRNYEFQFVDRWGGRKYIFLTIALIPGTKQSIVSLLDITERKKVEQMKSDFVSLVSHQLKTPVAQLKGYVYNMLIGLTGDLTSKQREYLEDMQAISGKNYKLVSDLLNVSRIERGVISTDIKSVALQDIVSGVLGPYYAQIKAKGLALNVEGLDNKIFVRADKEKLSEALSNAVDNALKFTDSGSITVQVYTEGGFANIAVIDTGRGILPERLARMFSRDMALDGGPVPGGGAGLGLYIAKQFLLLQKGDIIVRSEPGRGSTLLFTIPLAA